MPIIGYKKSFNNIKSLEGNIFTINFNLEYSDYGSLHIKDEEDNYFDVGDFNILIDGIFDDFDDKKFQEYDIGIVILSNCKYVVDKIPRLHSINVESKTMIDTYLKQEIIDDYNRIKKYKDDNILKISCDKK